MMKKLLLLLVLFLSFQAHSQIRKLNELSSNLFLDSKIIYEENSDEVYGYLLMFQNDKVAKDMFEIEYFVLDRNLNNVSSGRFTQNRFAGLLAKAFLDNFQLKYVQKVKDRVYFDLFQNVNEDPRNISYRYIDLKNNKVSELYYFSDFKPEIQSGRLGANGLKYMNLYVTTQCGMLVANNNASSGGYRSKTLKLFDWNLNPKWTLNLNEEGKPQTYYSYSTSDSTTLILWASSDEYSRYEVYDSTGKKRFDISLKADDIHYMYSKTFLEKNQIIVYAEMFKMQKNKFDYTKSLGFVKMAYDQLTGKILSKDEFRWKQANQYLDTDEYGQLKTGENIQFVNFQRTSDGKTLVVAEGYRYGKLLKETLFGFNGGSEIYDLFFFVFDENMKPVDFKRVNKVKNTVLMNGYGRHLLSSGAFDFAYSQQLPEKDSYVFFYQDNERLRGKNPKNALWVLGMLTYADGKIDSEKIPLKTENGRIYPSKAKRGYVLLLDKNDTDSELRLEKINF